MKEYKMSNEKEVKEFLTDMMNLIEGYGFTYSKTKEYMTSWFLMINTNPKLTTLEKSNLHCYILDNVYRFINK